MSKRNTHVPKTKAHQTAYRRYIEKLDYEPTVDERLNFQQTNQAAEIVSEKLTNRKRPSTVVDEVKLHMSKHWLEWAFAFAAIVIIYLFIDSKVASAKITIQLGAQDKELQETRQRVKESLNGDQEQDIKIAETIVKIGGIEKGLDETKSEVKALRVDVQSAVIKIRGKQQLERGN